MHAKVCKQDIADHGKQGLFIILVLLRCFFCLFLFVITSTLLCFLQGPSTQSDWHFDAV